MKTRPLGFTLLALAFGWLTLAGVGNAAMFFARERPIVGLLALAYAGAAALTTAGLWGVRPWAVTPLRLWILVCVVLPAVLPAASLASLTASIRVPLLFLVAVLLWLLHRYVSRTLRERSG